MIFTIIVFFAVLSLLILIHECGHFFTARFFGIKVDEFGLGLPPRIIGWQVFKNRKDKKGALVLGKKVPTDANGAIDDGVIYSLNWIPFGGFVKIKGENGEEAGANDSFSAKPAWQRAIVLSAGVIMNALLCVAFLSIGFGVGMPAAIDSSFNQSQISDRKLQVAQVFPDMPARQLGIEAGDEIMAVNDKQVLTLDEFKASISGSIGQKVAIKIKRNNIESIKDVQVVESNGAGVIGVGLVETAIVRFPWYQAIWQGLKGTFNWSVLMVVTFYDIIKNLIIHKPIGVEVAGPVGIAVMTGQAANLGIIYLLQFISMLSLNLAIINILPFPALDGGRLLFIAIEKIRGKSVSQKWENFSHNIGFLLLMLLIVVVTYKDLMRYGGKIIGFFGKLFGF